MPQIDHLPTEPFAGFTGNAKSICNFCSIGCALKLELKDGIIARVTGHEGLVNPEGEFCRIPEEVFASIKGRSRVTKPMLRMNDRFEPISWDEAFSVVIDKIKTSIPEETAFFAGARLANEEQYLIQKLARAGAKTNNIGSFHYLGRGKGYARLSKANLPFPELELTSRVYLIGADVENDYPVLAGFIRYNQQERGMSVELIGNHATENSTLKIDKFTKVASDYHFAKAINHYLLSQNLQNQTFVEHLLGNFSDYREKLLAESFETLVQLSGVENAEVVVQFALDFINEPAAVIIFSEKELSGHCCGEIFNLACITGKHGKTGSGLILLKEKNNSHGLHDMGVMSQLSPGADDWNDPMVRQQFEHAWQCETLPSDYGLTLHNLIEGKYKRLFIFGEDPVGCAIEPDKFARIISKSEFTVVQDYFMTETAALADLVLPASFPWETGGTYTNTQKVIQKTNPLPALADEMVSWKQLDALLQQLDLGLFDSVDDITFEMAGLLPRYCTSSKLGLRISSSDNYNPLFRFGCDALQK